MLGDFPDACFVVGLDGLLEVEDVKGFGAADVLSKYGEGDGGFWG